MAANGDLGRVPMVRDDVSFQDLQRRRLQEIEKRLQDEMRKKKKEWEKSVNQMRDEFLKLYPEDKNWGSEELLDDPLVYRRRGSTDVLDRRKMKTLFMDYPDSGRRFKLRFDVSQYDNDTIHVSTDSDRITVKAKQKEMDEDGTEKYIDFCRKIERPSEVDPDKLKSFMTNDGILIVEAQLPPNSINFRKQSHSSPSHSSLASSRSRSPSNSPHTPGSSKGDLSTPRPGIVTFGGAPNERRMNLLVEIGLMFKPRDITVQVVTTACIMVKAKREERTAERFHKSKFTKQYELSEKIEPYSLRAGLTEDGKLIIGALGIEHEAIHKEGKKIAGRKLAEELQKSSTMCNVLDLHSFPPVTPQ